MRSPRPSRVSGVMHAVCRNALVGGICWVDAVGMRGGMPAGSLVGHLAEVPVVCPIGPVVRPGPIMRRVERSACREFGPRGRCFVHAWCGSRLWFCSGLWFWIYAVAAQSVWRALCAVMPGVLRLLLSGELLFLLFFCELSPRCPDMRGLGHADFFWSRLQRHGLLHLRCMRRDAVFGELRGVWAEQACWLCLALGLRCCGCMLGGRCNMRVRKIEEVGVGSVNQAAAHGTLFCVPRSKSGFHATGLCVLSLLRGL